MKTILWAIVPSLFLTYQLRMVLPGLAVFAVIVTGTLMFEQLTRRV